MIEGKSQNFNRSRVFHIHSFYLVLSFSPVGAPSSCVLKSDFFSKMREMEIYCKYNEDPAQQTLTT